MNPALQLLIAAVAAVLMVTVIVPWLLRRAFGLRPVRCDDWRQRVALRYEKLGTHPWMFAWFKTRLDPMFAELPELLKRAPQLETIFDLGCGYGVAGCALLEWLPQARIWGVDPNPRRVRRAAAAFGQRGVARQGGAPQIPFPDVPEKFDVVLVLDVIHYIVDDSDVTRALEQIRAKLNDGGYLFLRANVPPAGQATWYWNWEAMRRSITGAVENHRSVSQVRDAITRAGFDIEFSAISGGNPELHWFIATTRASTSAPE
jgi:SAM-dependent methyltransferase